MRALELIGAMVVAVLIYRGLLWTYARRNKTPEEGQKTNEK